MQMTSVVHDIQTDGDFVDALSRLGSRTSSGLSAFSESLVLSRTQPVTRSGVTHHCRSTSGMPTCTMQQISMVPMLMHRHG